MRTLKLSNRNFKKFEKFTKEWIKERQELIRDQKPPKKPQAQLPAADFLPDPQIANLFAANVNQITGLTDTETALLSPEEQIIARRLRT